MTKTKKREVVGTFDPYKGALLRPGLWPANIIKITTVERPTKIGNVISYGLDYVISKDCAKMKQPFYQKLSDGNFEFDEDNNMVVQQDDKGEAIEISCSFAIGKEIRFHSIPLFTEDEGRHANGSYMGLMEIAGVEAEIVEVQSGVKVKQLVKLDEDDLLGKPVLINLNYKAVVTRETKSLPKDQQEFRYWLNVISAISYDSGETIEVFKEEEEENLPF